MPSTDGFPEPQRSDFERDMQQPLSEGNRVRVFSLAAIREATAPPKRDLTPEEEGWIADGMSYCFNCGLPAESFAEYREGDGVDTNADAYVRTEEGTYNPATNRFACDGCYIEIGMPSSPNGWVAP